MRVMQRLKRLGVTLLVLVVLGPSLVAVIAGLFDSWETYFLLMLASIFSYLRLRGRTKGNDSGGHGRSGAERIPVDPEAIFTSDEGD